MKSRHPELHRPYHVKPCLVLERWDLTLQNTHCLFPVGIHQIGYSNDLVIDFAHHRVTLCEQEINVTATEYRLLSYLVHNAGGVVTPDQILKKVWGEEYMGEHHLLRVSIARLRQKLEDDPKKPRFIATKIGIGYTFLKSR